MLNGVSGNAPKKFTMVRKIHRENDRTSEDPSLSGYDALVWRRSIIKWIVRNITTRPTHLEFCYTSLSITSLDKLNFAKIWEDWPGVE
jgi:hypothetical protein